MPYRFQYRNKKDRLVVALEDEEKVVIPSRLFPLERKSYQLINDENTRPVEEQKITDIFDSIKYEVGKCYSNAEKLTEALRKEGYPAIQYVGWLFSGEGTYPVHHSFVLLYDHVLDLSIEFLERDIYDLRYATLKHNLSADGGRRYIVQKYLEKQQVKNHQKCKFGKCDKYYMYVAAEGSREEGIARNELLRKEYPSHPAFRDVHNGMTETQRLLYKFQR